MSYENETCEGCRHYPEMAGMNCLHPELENEKDWPDLRDRCDQFTPSLLCRKVRALEKLATCVGHHIGADHPVIAVAEQTRLHENA